jgi:hypothetical protein
MLVQYLKLAEQGYEEGSQVLDAFQSNKFESEVFDDSIGKFCYLKGVLLKYSHMSKAAKCFPAPLSPNPAM